jgi:hypothetical protein
MGSLGSVMDAHGQALLDYFNGETENSVLIHSIDPRHPTDELYKRYIEHKAAQGAYLGERTLRFEYKGCRSDWFEWAHIDSETLERHVRRAGLDFELIAAESRRYLALIKRG